VPLKRVDIGSQVGARGARLHGVTRGTTLRAKRLRLDSPSPHWNVVCMRASFFTNYGAPEVLGLQDLLVPVPEDDEKHGQIVVHVAHGSKVVAGSVL
jgi:hypothetical protein